MAISYTAEQNATATNVRSGATRIKSIEIFMPVDDNPVLYLQVFNSNSPTVGTTAPYLVIPIHAGQTDKQGRQKAIFASERGGLLLPSGLSYAVTTTPTNNTGPDSGDEPGVRVSWAEAA